MQSGPHDLARVRLDNALALFDEFVRNTVKSPDAATLRGLEGRFAERLQIQPSYWSQIKSHARQIGERLARQFERQCRKPVGWMDVPHGPGTAGDAAPRQNAGATVADAREALDNPVPQDDDERFIVGLVLTYYRRHPQRARTRLLDLLGEVLSAAPAPTSAAVSRPAKPGATRPGTPAGGPPQPSVRSDDAQTLWQRSQRDVAPLKRKR